MSLISDRTGVLRSQEAITFINRFQKSINLRLTGMEADASLQLLHDILNSLRREESAVNRSVWEIEGLLNSMTATVSSDELGGLAARFHQLVADQFANRASVRTFHALYARFLELLICAAFASARAMLQSEGIDFHEDSWCVLVSGKLGRGEPGHRCLERVIFLADDSAGFAKEIINEFAYRTLAILEQLLGQGGGKTVPGRYQFWSGSLTEWLGLVDDGLKGGGSSFTDGNTLADADLFADTVRMIADLRPLCGALPLAEAAVSSSRRRIAAELPGERFWQFAKQTAAMPVALGFFGKFRTVKTGKQRGKFDLEELAINPLTAAIRAMAVANGITETSTVARIKAILATGNLGVTLADRLLTAHHDFMKTLIELELSNPNGNERVFFNPGTLDEQSRERFRTGLEDITTLQRLVYQQLVEVD